MPRSIYTLFISIHNDKAEIDEILVARIRDFNYKEKRFRVIEIEPTEDDITGETVFVYRGVYIGDYP